MSKREGDRPEARGLGKVLSAVAKGMAIALMMSAVAPQPIHAQFGMLKKLKNKVSAPDSAARAKDSLAQIAAGVKPESVKVGDKGWLAKGAKVVSTANGALESATGISAKDAALAATGVGASNILAKKLGVDPMSIGAQAVANAKMNAQQRAMQKATGAAGMPGGAGMDAAAMQEMQRAAMANAGANRAAMGAAMSGNAAMAGMSQADVDALMAFQTEMSRLSMAASAGDPAARARLLQWEQIALKYQPEMQRLSIAASGGDMTAIEKLQRMQFDLIREWTGTRAGHANPRK
jgi:hypothetical protein